MITILSVILPAAYPLRLHAALDMIGTETCCNVFDTSPPSFSVPFFKKNSDSEYKMTSQHAISITPSSDDALLFDFIVSYSNKKYQLMCCFQLKMISNSYVTSRIPFTLRRHTNWIQNPLKFHPLIKFNNGDVIVKCRLRIPWVFCDFHDL